MNTGMHVTVSTYRHTCKANDPSSSLKISGYSVKPGDCGSISGRVIPKTQKMVLDTSLLNTQHYKVCIKGKVEQFKERSSALPPHFGVVAIEKGAFGQPSTTVANFTLLLLFPF